MVIAQARAAVGSVEIVLMLGWLAWMMTDRWLICNLNDANTLSTSKESLMWRSVQGLIPVATVGFLFGATLPLAAEPKVDPARKDLEKLQGSWNLVYWLVYGDERPTADRKIVLTFKGSKLTIREGDKVIEEASIKDLDPGKQQKTFEYVSDKGNYPAIYLVEGDLFIACVGYSGRPATFSAEEGSKNELVVYKRVKK
jgi:uncharacterized protein (TIGR03067 family)